MHSVMRRCVQFFLVLVGIVCSFSAQAAYEFTTVDYPLAVSTQFWGINNSGQIVGEAFFADRSQINFLYDQNKQAFTILPSVPGADSTNFLGINEPGFVVGSVTDGDNHQTGLIRDKKGVFTLFSHPGWDNTLARAVGPSGLVTGLASDDSPGSTVGFIYDPARNSFIDISFPASGPVIAQGINGRGVVVGSADLPPGGAYPGSPPREYGFLRGKSGAITLFRVNDPGTRTRARSITDSGLVAGFIGPFGALKGFVGSLSGVSGYELLVVPAANLLEVPGAANTIPQGIDNAGRIVGSWDDGNADGNQHGFIATPLPN